MDPVPDRSPVPAWVDRIAGRVLGQLDPWRCRAAAPLLWISRWSDQRPIIRADARRWAECLWLEADGSTLGLLLFAFPEFRAVYYHRLKGGNPTGRLLGRLAARIWRATPGLDLADSVIGPGLFIAHGQGTIISAERVGADVTVHQGVTVGWDYRGDRRPILGDRVFIGAGAKVLGAITIGDDARIGANAVVVRDVPSGATAVGAPARVLDPAIGRPRGTGEPTEPTDGP